MSKLLIATRNRGKLREYRELLGGVDAELLCLDDVGIDDDVEETGVSFEENAVIKAKAYAALGGMLTIADDSGVVIDALGGEPGIYSARYGGTEPHQEAERRRLVLRKLLEVPSGDRTARFICVVAIVTPTGEVQTAEGRVEGVIAYEEAGDNGFGYDPIFYMPERDATMAQLPSEEKNAISHRGRALAAARPTLLRLLSEG
jgi:XTP/dITP diphosphohydrolase